MVLCAAESVASRQMIALSNGCEKKTSLRLSKCIKRSLIVSMAWVVLLLESCWPHFRYLGVIGSRHFAHFLLDAEVIFKKVIWYHAPYMWTIKGKHLFFFRNDLYRNIRTYSGISPTLAKCPLVEWMPATQENIFPQYWVCWTKSRPKVA